VTGSGAPAAAASGLDGSALRVGVVSASWHADVMAGLRDGARRALAEAGVRQVLSIEVPGSFELPVAAARLAAAGADAVVALGVVIRGGTPHFDYVCSATTGLVEVSTRTGVPVGFGVLTCDTLEQAIQRAGGPGAAEDKGHEAASAALATALALRTLPRPDAPAPPRRAPVPSGTAAERPEP
jgi:6,7-dimethyl-8-ribityllumazine synthase